MELKTPLMTHMSNWREDSAFGGYLLPIEYETGMLKEHLAVRQAAGCSMFHIWARSSLKGRERLILLISL